MKSRRSFLGQSSAAAFAAAAPARKPNLVFVFSDQQSWDMLGCYGNKQIVTPTLDRFAGEGVRFEHCVSNSPLCTPYRGVLLSGRHPLHNGAVTNDIRMFPGKGQHFGEVLRDSGYATGYVGKWHLYGGNRVRPIPAGPDRYGFDGTFLSNNCTVVFDAPRAYYWNERGERTLYNDWEPYAQARQAETFIDENHAKPFAMFLSWHPPHNWNSGAASQGYGAPEDVTKLYDPASIKLRANCPDNEVTRKIYQGHMAMCTSLDRAFGGILKKIEQHGLTNDTIVVYTSDHGDTLLSHGLQFNKMRPEAESIRVPLMIRYPAKLKPRKSELVVGTLDLMPTLLGMMGLPVPKAADGRDLSGAIATANDRASEEAPLFLLPLDWRGVYTKRYTYCEDTSAGTVSAFRERYFREPAGIQWNCLYDRQNDPAEMRNLFTNSRLRAGLREKTQAWMRRFGDTGAPYRQLVDKTYSAPDAELYHSGRFAQVSGVLKGRPAELL